MALLKGMKFTRSNDANMFKNVLTKMYPQLNYTVEEGYVNNDVNKGSTTSQLIGNLSKDLSLQKLPNKFVGYPDYLLKLSKKNQRDDRILKLFSSIITEFSGYHVLSIRKIKTKDTVVTTDKNVVKMKDVDIEVVEGEIKNIKIGEIEIIPERIITKTTETTTLEMIMSNYNNYLEEAQKLPLNTSNPLVKKYSTQAKKEIAIRGSLDEFAIDKLHSYLLLDVVNCEETYFSYNKCQKFLEVWYQKYRSSPGKNVYRILSRIFDEDDDVTSGDILVDVYDFLSDDVGNLSSDSLGQSYTYNESVYIQLKMLSFKLNHFLTRGKIFWFSSDENLLECEDELDKLANLCMFQDVPLRDFPVNITLS